MKPNKAAFATRMIFLICGLSLSSWAPMVPYAKDQLHLDDASLGLLLLFLGGGALCTMPVSGWFIHRVGSRTVITVAAITIALFLPILLTMHQWAAMAAALFLFGAGIGTIDVAMNTHAVQIQNILGRHIMSSFHGLFSVGGLLGPLVIGAFLKAGLSPLTSAIIISTLLLIIVATQYKSLMNAQQEKETTQRFSNAGAGNDTPGAKRGWLTAAVLFIGALCFASFLAEGALLDWSAVFLRDNKGVQNAFTGIGYAAFSIAMAIMRLFGDSIISKVPAKTVVLIGGTLGFAGFLLAVFAPWLPLVLAGFILIGIGAANMVPVFFTAAGNIRDVNAASAISAVSTMGYAGQLVGPALLGFIAHQYSLNTALIVTGALLFFAGISFTTTKQQEHA